jgi:hypothetical protein
MTHYGSGWIPSNTDMKYEFEVLECSLDPKHFKPEPPVDNFKEADVPDKEIGYFFRSLGLNKYGKQMVLDVDEEDKYAPLKTGVHNVFLTEKKEGSKTQKFFYDKDEQKISNEFLPGSALMEGYNHNLVMYYDKNLARQKFWYDKRFKHLVGEETKNWVAVQDGEIDHKANLITLPP